MDCVYGPDGAFALVVGRDGDRVRLREPATGQTRLVPTGEFDPVDVDPLVFVARAIGGSPLGSDERTVGLLAELVDRGPTTARALLADYDACESDVQGMLAELRVAGLIEGTRVAGVPGYSVTEDGRATVERRREMSS